MLSDVHKKIADRRKRLELLDTEVAAAIGITVDSYCDIEWHADEIYTLVDLREVKRLCEVLKFEFLELFELPCAFCEEGRPYSEEYRLPRNQLIQERRKAQNLSQDELGDRVGFYGDVIAAMERDPNYLETWGINNILELAAVLNIPPQVLFAVKCPKCGR